MVFQSIAVMVFIVFYGCYFIKMICQKRKGIQTDQLGKGKVGFVKYVEITMKITAVLVFVAGMVSIFKGTGSRYLIFQVIGAVLSIMGTAVFIAAVMTMRDNWRAGVPEADKTELVTEGIYQISRNPAFLGFDLLYLVILLLFFNWILYAFTVLAICMYHLQIVNVEEDFLTVTFGEEYLKYKKKVCRYIGRKG